MHIDNQINSFFNKPFGKDMIQKSNKERSQFSNSITFGSKDYSSIPLNILKALTSDSSKIEKYSTKAHRDNIFFRTNLNEKLRNPNSCYVDDVMYSLADKMDSLKLGIGKYYQKIPIREDVHLLKIRLNNEFDNLPGLSEDKKYFRGITDISDDIYKKMVNYKAGDVVVPDEGFAYIAEELEQASVYLSGRNNVLFELEFPAGSKISKLCAIMPPRSPSTFMFGEIKNESVVKAGASYEVIKKPEVDDNGILHVFLKYIN